MVITRMLASLVILAFTASIPSVSRRMRTNSSHSRAVVPIQIPKVLASIVWPRANALDDPSMRERMYDLPVRYGPQIDRTATGFSIPSSSVNASCATSNLLRVTPSLGRSWFVLGSYSQSSGRISGMEGGSESVPVILSLSGVNVLCVAMATID